MITENKNNRVNVICILWGDKYGAQDVNCLYSMIKRNTSYEINFILFTDEIIPSLADEITVVEAPHLNTDVNHSKYAYRKEAALCDDNLANLTSERVFFFDLDVVIVGNLDHLFAYPKNDEFYIINDWNTLGNHVGQASCYSYVVGTLGKIKLYFEANAQSVINEYGSASQEYLSAMILKIGRKINFWPEEWCKSFKFHCLPTPLMRYFIQPKKPPHGSILIAFHGCPDIKNALLGNWADPGFGNWSDRTWKKLYKSCRPTKWIKEYWYY